MEQRVTKRNKLNKRNQVNSIVKAFKLMEALATEREFELARLSRLVQLPKTTAHRILLTLNSLGYVEHDPQTLRYRPSIKLFELGSGVVRFMDFTEIAKPYMFELSHKTDETINLGVLSGLDIVCIHKVESKHHLRHEQPLGSRAKAHCTGMGKSVLAFLSPEERTRLYAEYGLSPSTARSLATVEELEQHLQGVRDRGYAIDNEEGMLGVRCVGAPIFDHNRKPVAGLSIAGPCTRVSEDNIQHFAGLVMETAALISRKLGFSGEMRQLA